MAITSENIQSLNAQCKIIWMPVFADYNITLLHQSVSGSVSSNLTDYFSNSAAFDISSHLIDGLTYNKFMDSAAGTFSFKLDNSRDWTATMHPGQWCLIYLANDGSLTLDNSTEGGFANFIPNTDDLPLISSENDAQIQQFAKNLRCIGFIERVASTSRSNEDGGLEIEYEVSGRDMGVVYEDTELYYNHFIYEEGKVGGLMLQVYANKFFQPLDKVMQIVHDLFLFPSNLPLIRDQWGPTASLLTIGLQWLLPTRLGQILGLNFNGTTTFFGAAQGITNFSPSLLPISLQDPLTFLVGNVWQKLKEMSLPAFNELFFELNANGSPQLNFRPIPWGVDQRGYPELANGQQAFIPSYYNFVSGNLGAQNVVNYTTDAFITGFDLGRDNHSRYNYFLCRYADLDSVQDTVPFLQNQKSPANRAFPNMDQPDLMRFGLRLREEVVNSFSFALASTGFNDLISKLTSALNGLPAQKFLIEFNEVLRDYWKNAIFFEGGTIEQTGDPNIRIGKAITFAPTIAQLGNKAYYVEGYTDRFLVGPNGEHEWSQSLQVTRGIDMTLLKQASTFPGIDNNIVNPNLTQAEKTQRSNPIVGSFVKKM